MPLSRSLGDGLFELRFALASTARRITYRFTNDGRIVLLTTSASNATTNAPRWTEHARSLRTAPSATPEGENRGQLLPVG
jgi:hypothetical protein